MTEETGKVLYGPWPKRIDPPLSLDVFHEQAQHYLKNLNVARDSLSYACKLFRGGRDIWPDQCERALALIDAVSKLVQEIYQSVDSASRLPEAVVPLRYPLAVALCHLDDQMSELMQLITIFHATCKKTSVQMISQREEIHHQIEPLMQSYDDVLHKLYTLLDQAHFQERKRASF